MLSTPDSTHTIIACPMEPEYRSTPFGDTKMPAPTITPTMIATPSIRPSSLRSWTPPPLLLVLSSASLLPPPPPLAALFFVGVVVVDLVLAFIVPSLVTSSVSLNTFRGVRLSPAWTRAMLSVMLLLIWSASRWCLPSMVLLLHAHASAAAAAAASDAADADDVAAAAADGVVFRGNCADVSGERRMRQSQRNHSVRWECCTRARCCVSVGVKSMRMVKRLREYFADIQIYNIKCSTIWVLTRLVQPSQRPHWSTEIMFNITISFINWCQKSIQQIDNLIVSWQKRIHLDQHKSQCLLYTHNSRSQKHTTYCIRTTHHKYYIEYDYIVHAKGLSHYIVFAILLSSPKKKSVMFVALAPVLTFQSIISRPAGDAKRNSQTNRPLCCYRPFFCFWSQRILCVHHHMPNIYTKHNSATRAVDTCKRRRNNRQNQRVKKPRKTPAHSGNWKAKNNDWIVRPRCLSTKHEMRAGPACRACCCEQNTYALCARCVLCEWVRVHYCASHMYCVVGLCILGICTILVHAYMEAALCICTSQCAGLWAQRVTENWIHIHNCNELYSERNTAMDWVK